MMFLQLGTSLTDIEITRRLVYSLSDHLDGPVHCVPPVRLLPATKEWPRRGVMEVRFKERG